MSKLVWDVLNERVYELGVDHGVLYLNGTGSYDLSYVWNGLTSVQENPEGGELTDQYADNIKYFSLQSTEKYKATVEAFTYPDAWGECDGSAEVSTGVYFGQQNRKSFGFSYRTKIGNAEEGQDVGYKLHLVYGCKAAPSSKNYETINDSPSAITFSWEIDSTPVSVDGYKPVSHIAIDSTKVDATKLAQLEDLLYGTDAQAEKPAVYKETEDTSPQPGKTYYTKSGDVYTEFTGSTFATGTTYYELVTPAVPAKEATVGRLPLPEEVKALFTSN